MSQGCLRRTTRTRWPYHRHQRWHGERHPADRRHCPSDQHFAARACPFIRPWRSRQVSLLEHPGHSVCGSRRRHGVDLRVTGHTRGGTYGITDTRSLLIQFLRSSRTSMSWSHAPPRTTFIDSHWGCGSTSVALPIQIGPSIAAISQEWRMAALP